MVEIWIDGDRVEAEDGQTVMQAARASGHEIPYFCWHPALSVPGNCRICMVEVEGDGASAGWLDIACNMPVAKGMRVLTDSERVRARRKEMLQLVTLNHPVDCGICDKAGECTLQDYHYEYNGEPSVSRDAKVQATKHHALSERIVLDNERCILCSRCVRFTREISKSDGLGIQHRGDHSLVRAVENGAFERDPYSDNVIDLCPVGALLSVPFLHKARVWYLEPTPSICPGCERGCSVDIWHRKKDWKLNRLDPAANARIDRVTPRENPAVNGPWICNKGRDLAALFERPRATAAMIRGAAVNLEAAVEQARRADRRCAPPGRAGLELGLERGAGRLPCRVRRQLRLPRQDRPPAGAGRAPRGRAAHQARQEPEPARRAPPSIRRCPTRRAPPSPPDATSCWCGARAATSTPCRPARRSSTSTPGGIRRRPAPTSSCRSACRPSAAATTPTSPAW